MLEEVIKEKRPVGFIAICERCANSTSFVAPDEATDPSKMLEGFLGRLRWSGWWINEDEYVLCPSCREILEGRLGKGLPRKGSPVKIPKAPRSEPVDIAECRF